jgi:cobalt/nickel transport system permease protein
VLASGTFALELAASVGWSDFFNVLGWMALVHAGIGLGEAVITGMVLRFVLLARPDILYDSRPAGFSAIGRLGQAGLGGSRHRPGGGGLPGTVCVGV